VTSLSDCREFDLAHSSDSGIDRKLQLRLQPNANLVAVSNSSLTPDSPPRVTAKGQPGLECWRQGLTTDLGWSPVNELVV